MNTLVDSQQHEKADAPTTGLYDQDFVQWSQQMADHLRAGRFTELDIENIAEEIESLGRSDKRELSNRMEQLTKHLLKWEFQPERRGASWEETIDEQRRQVRVLLDESPSLRPLLAARLAGIYAESVRTASKETRLPRHNFPADCPYAVEQLLDEDFLPGQ